MDSFFVLLAASAACVNKDPAIFENPEEFDGFRYHNLRQKEGFRKSDPVGKRNRLENFAIHSDLQGWIHSLSFFNA
jgi:hypothetical protein